MAATIGGKKSQMTEYSMQAQIFARIAEDKCNFVFGAEIQDGHKK